MTLFPDKQLTERLKVIARRIHTNESFADIGSDHGYLPCYVCSRDKTVQALVGEINKGPLKNAQTNIKKYQLENQIETRLGNGLEILKETDIIDKIVIAGMGGKLIKNILENDLTKISPQMKIILQPNNNEPSLRRFLMTHNFQVLNEEMVIDNGIIYEIIEAQLSQDTINYSERELLLGPLLCKNKSKLFIEKWSAELIHLKTVLNQMKKSKSVDTIKLKTYQNIIEIIEEEI